MVTCGGSAPVLVAAGSSCSVSGNPDGSATIACDDGSSFVLGRPSPEGDTATLELLAGVTSVGSNDGLGTESRMDGALHATFSPDGNFLYFVDTFNLTIRRFGITSGRVVTLAGAPGLEGVDDGIGAAARFQGPRGIAIDPAGETLYIADGFNCTIRTLALATNEVRTLLGVPRACAYVDGDFNVARLGLVIGMAMRDARYVYLAQRANGANAIRRIDLETQRIQTIAGGSVSGYVDGPGSSARFAGPGGIDFDETGEWLWVNDTFNQVIRRISLAETTVADDGVTLINTFRVETVAGVRGSAGHVDGPGVDARFSVSQGLTWARDGVYVAGFHNTIRRISPLPPYTVTTVAGRNRDGDSTDGHPFEARFGVAFGIHAHPDGERIYYMDRGNNNIREFNLTVGRVTTVMGAPQPTGWRDGDALDARFNDPSGVITDGTGRFVYIADEGNSVIRRFDTWKSGVETIAGLPNTFGFRDGVADASLFDEPSEFAFNADGSVLWISDLANHAIRALDVETLALSTVTGGPERSVELQDGEVPTGTLLEGPLEDVAWGHISGLAFDGDTGLLYASDEGLNLIRVIDVTLGTVRSLAGGNTPPLVPSLDAGGQPVLDANGDPVLVTAEEYEVDGIGEQAILDGPFGLALSADGGTLYVADRGHHLVRQVDTATGEVVTLAGEYGVPGAFDDIGLDAAFDFPRSVALSTDGARLFVVDSSNHAVRRIDLPTREVSTVVGELGISGGFGFRFTPLTIARLYFPAAVTVDGDDLLITAENALYRARGAATAE